MTFQVKVYALIVWPDLVGNYFVLLIFSDLELKQLSSGNVNLSASTNSAATAAAMLANGYSALPFLQHLSAAANSMPSSQQQQQLVAAAAALGLPALPNR